MDTLSIGPIHTMLQNVIYALPPTGSVIFSSTAGATFQQSNSSTFADSQPITLTEGVGGWLPGGFIRSTAGNAVVKFQGISP